MQSSSSRSPLGVLSIDDETTRTPLVNVLSLKSDDLSTKSNSRGPSPLTSETVDRGKGGSSSRPFKWKCNDCDFNVHPHDNNKNHILLTCSRMTWPLWWAASTTDGGGIIGQTGSEMTVTTAPSTLSAVIELALVSLSLSVGSWGTDCNGAVSWDADVFDEPTASSWAVAWFSHSLVFSPSLHRRWMSPIWKNNW